MNDSTYNGWKNRATWNVAMWINGDEPLYRTACAFVRTWGSDPTYRAFADNYLCAYGAGTPDGIAWNDPTLDTDALDEMLAELLD